LSKFSGQNDHDAEDRNIDGTQVRRTEGARGRRLPENGARSPTKDRAGPNDGVLSFERLGVGARTGLAAGRTGAPGGLSPVLFHESPVDFDAEAGFVVEIRVTVPHLRALAVEPE
jgi:hypothetical protein